MVKLAKIFNVINEMKDNGIIEDYALGGAFAAVIYSETFSTNDMDFFINFKSSGLISLSGIFSYLKNAGYDTYGEDGSILIEDFPVQFLSTGNNLEIDAVENAGSITFDGIVGKIITPEYLVAIALNIGRPKDRNRIVQMLELNKVNLVALCEVFNKHGLINKWINFCNLMGVINHCVK